MTSNFSQLKSTFIESFRPTALLQINREFYYSASAGECSIAISSSVCLSLCVCLSANIDYLWNCWTDLHEIFVCRSHVAVVGPPQAALRYRSGV